jgi:autotransporter translocation and assembly factor TamB
MVSSRGWARALRILLGVVCSAVVLAAVAIGVSVAYLESEPGRRFVAAETTRLLAPLFRGRLDIESLGGVGLYAVSGVNGTVRDAEGRPVLVVRGARARVATWALVRSALGANGRAIAVQLTDVAADEVDLRLDRDGAGQTAIAGAFEPHSSGGPGSRGRSVRLVATGVIIRHARVHGDIPGTPRLDIDVNDARGAVSYSPELFEVNVARATVVAHGLAGEADLSGVLEVHARQRGTSLSTLDARLSWRGDLAGLGHSFEASIRENRLRAVLVVPAVDPASVRALWSHSPIEASGSLHVDVLGTLPSLDVDIEAALGPAGLRASGPVVVLGERSASLDVAVHDFDLHELTAGVPASRLGLAGHVSVSQGASGALAMDAALALLGGTFGAYDIPGGLLRAVAAGPSLTRLRGHADLAVQGGSMPTHATLDLAPLGESFGLEVAVESSSPHLERLPLLASGLRGSARAAIKATLDLSKSMVDARVTASAAHAVLGPLRIESTSASARVWGSIAAPSLDGAGRAHGAEVLGHRFSTIAWTATGKLRSPHLGVSANGPDAPTVAATADLGGGDGLSLRDVRLSVQRAGERAVATAHRIHVNGGSVRVLGGRVEGLGEPIEVAFERSPAALRVRVATDGIDLARLGRLVRQGPRPPGGTLAVQGDLTILDGRARGTVKARARLANGTSLDLGGPSPWRVDGLDIEVDALVGGAVGETEVQVGLRDKEGAIGAISLVMPRFPYGDVFGSFERLAVDARALPFDMRATVARRALADLPAPLNDGRVAGVIEGQLHATGTLSAPSLQIAASLHAPIFSWEARPFLTDVDVEAHYDGRRGSASLVARQGDQRVVDVDATLDAPLAQWPVWAASARAHITALPLEAIALLDDKLVSGQLEGDLAVTDFHKDSHAEATLVTNDLHIGGAVTKASLRASIDGQTGQLTMRMDQADGYAEANAHVATHWGAASAPALDPDRPLDVAVTSKNFRLAALLPLVAGSLDELDGRVDADAQIRLSPNTQATTLSGRMSLDGGVVEAVVAGGELHDVRASVTFNPDGTVVLDPFTAAGRTGHVSGSASAHVEGGRFRSAKGHFSIPADSAMPLTVRGVDLGLVDGAADFSATASDRERTLDWDVNVPRMRVTLAQGTSGNARELGPLESVRIGAHPDGGGRFVLVPLDAATTSAPKQSARPLRTVFNVRMSDVEVVRAAQLQVVLDGALHIPLGTTAMTGQIHLRKGGLLHVQGRPFEIESGVITMTGGDASNPEVVVRASYTARDGTIVYATFAGPLATGKVTLSSEPALTQQEIVALLVYGTTDGQQGSQPGGSTPGIAIATAGGQAAEPFNHVLDQLGLGAVTTRVDTSQSANPTPEVAVQIARDISVQLAVVLGQPPPGVNPDHTLLTLAWRFLSRWSLASTFGDAGTTIVDLLWQKRY